MNARHAKTVMAAAATAVSLLATAAPSTATAATWQQGTVYLREPVPPNFGTSCVARNIRLKAGVYRWKIYLVPRFRPDASIDGTRHVRLRSGWYQWQDCLGAPDREYVQCSWLDELANGPGGAASSCQWPPARFGDGVLPLRQRPRLGGSLSRCVKIALDRPGRYAR